MHFNQTDPVSVSPLPCENQVGRNGTGLGSCPRNHLYNDEGGGAGRSGLISRFEPTCAKNNGTDDKSSWSVSQLREQRKDVMHDVEITNETKVEIDAHDGDTQCRATLMTKLLKEPAVLTEIGAGWLLFLHLVFVEGGRVVGTYDDIGQSMGTGGKTVRNWVKGLEERSVVKCERQGHRVSLELLGRHMAIAKAPDHIVKTVAADTIPLSPRMKTAMRIVEAAEAAGSTIECKVVI